MFWATLDLIPDHPPPHVTAAMAKLVALEAQQQKATRAGRAAMGEAWCRMKDDDSLAHLGVFALAALLKRHGNYDPAYLNKCIKLHRWEQSGRLREHDAFVARTGFSPNDRSEPSPSLLVEAALVGEQQKNKQIVSVTEMNDRTPLDHVVVEPDIRLITGGCRIKSLISGNMQLPLGKRPTIGANNVSKISSQAPEEAKLDGDHFTEWQHRGLEKARKLRYRGDLVGGMVE